MCRDHDCRAHAKKPHDKNQEEATIQDLFIRGTQDFGQETCDSICHVHCRSCLRGMDLRIASENDCQNSRRHDNKTYGGSGG
jgi:hypothetical protein